MAKLEAAVMRLVMDMTETRARLRETAKEITALRIQIATLKGKLDHFPSKCFVVSIVTMALAFSTAILLFQSKLQHFIGVVSHR